MISLFPIYFFSILVYVRLNFELIKVVNTVTEDTVPQQINCLVSVTFWKAKKYVKWNDVLKILLATKV